MRLTVLPRLNFKVAVTLLFSAVCQFGYFFKRIYGAASHEYKFFISELVSRLRDLPEPSDFKHLLKLRNLRRLIPSITTCLLYLVTFGAILPILSTQFSYTFYQRAFNSAKYYDRANFIREIVKGRNVTDQIVEENMSRLKKSVEVLDRVMLDYQPTVQEIRNSASFKDVVIGIITYSRDKYREPGDNDPRQYLTQLTASLVEKFHQYRKQKLLLPMGQRSLSMTLLMCNVDDDPDSHQEFRWLTNRLKIGGVNRKDQERFMNSCEDPSRKVTGMGPWGPFDYNSRYEKQKQDYTFCMNYFKSQSIYRYMLVLEDDVIPAPDFFFRIHELIFNRLDRNEYGSDYGSRRPSNIFFSPPVFMVKLHHPEAFLSFASAEYERIPQLFALATLFSLFIVVAQRLFPVLWQIFWLKNFDFDYKMTKRTSPEPEKDNEKLETIQKVKRTVCFAILDKVFTKQIDWLKYAKWFIFFSLVFLAIGRPNTYLVILNLLSQTMTAFPSYFMTLIQAPSCCVTAVLFPKRSVDEVINFFEENRCVRNWEPRDDMLFGDLSETHKFPSYLTEPNLFYHIGRYSSIRGRVNNNDFREWVGIPF